MQADQESRPLTTAAEEPDEQPVLSREQTLATVISVMLVLFLATLDQTIVATALPRIVADLHGFNNLSWVGTVYLLTSTVTIPIYGKISDLLGRKPILLFSIVLFLLGSALSGQARSLNELIVFRALQGIGAGGLQPIASAVVGDLFPPRQRGKWLGVTGSVYALASIIGPLAGGWLTDHFSWRAIFYVNIPIGLLALLVLFIFMPRLRTAAGKVFIDYGGAGLLVLGTVPLLLAFSWGGSEYSWLSAQISALFAVAMVVLSLLVVYAIYQERQGREPIVQPSLFVASWRVFGVASLVTVTLNMALMGSAYFIPLFIQGVIGISATSSGLVIIPLALAAIMGAVLCGLLLSLTGHYKWLALGGALIASGGSLLLVRLDVHAQWSDMLIAMLVLGFGMGVGQAVYTTAVQNALPESLGQATAALAFFRQLGGTISVAVLGSIVTSSYVPAFHAALPPALRQAIPARLLSVFDNPLVLLAPGDTLARIQAAFRAYGPQGTQAYAALLSAVRVGLASSLHNAFVLSAIIMGISLVSVSFLKELPLRRERTPRPWRGASDAAPPAVG
jgi:EmrB/QacA subfamily drug resistance transporter